jgi:hypothetical protein
MTPGALAAAVVSVGLAADAALGSVTDSDDHSTAAGATSEALFALVLIGTAVVCVTLVARQPDLASRASALLAVVGLVLSAGTAVSVPLRGSEPSEGWSTLVVLAALVGLVVLGVMVMVRRRWPWWVGLVLATFLPVVFFGGSVGASVPWWLRSPGLQSGQQDSDPLGTARPASADCWRKHP